MSFGRDYEDPSLRICSSLVEELNSSTLIGMLDRVNDPRGRLQEE